MTTELRESTSEILRTSPLYTRLKFVLSARSNPKDSRPILRLLKVETKDGKRYAYCADGFRLHIADITDTNLSVVLPHFKHFPFCTAIPDIYFVPILPSYTYSISHSFHAHKIETLQRASL